MAQPHQHATLPASVWTVEDDDGFRARLRAAIDSAHDLECTGAFATAEELFAALDRNRYLQPKALLLDIGLPGMDGILTVQKLRARGLTKELPVVMLTVHEDDDHIFRAICSGASGYHTKNSPRNEILNAIRTVVAGGASMSPQIARRVFNIFADLKTPSEDPGLTPRQMEVLTLLCKGKGNQRIAFELKISDHTVDTHIRDIYEKLHVNSRAAATAKAVGTGIVKY